MGLVQASTTVGLGLTALVWPDITGNALLLLIAMFALASGTIGITEIIFQGSPKSGALVGIIGGFINILFGGLLLTSPDKGALAVIWMIAFFSMFYGLSLLTLAWTLRSIERNAPPGDSRKRRPY